MVPFTHLKSNEESPQRCVLLVGVDLEGAYRTKPSHEKTKNLGFRPGPEVIKLFSCSAQLRLKFILLTNVLKNANDDLHLKFQFILAISVFMSTLNFKLS